MSDWETDEHGNIVLFPLMGFETAVGAQTVALLKIQFARSEAQMKSGGEAIQLVLPPDIARDLAFDLLQMTERLETAPPDGQLRN